MLEILRGFSKKIGKNIEKFRNMLLYDIAANYLKVYTGNPWKPEIFEKIIRNFASFFKFIQMLS